MPKKQTESYVTTGEFAKIAGITSQQVSMFVKQGKLERNSEKKLKLPDELDKLRMIQAMSTKAYKTAPGVLADVMQQARVDEQVYKAKNQQLKYEEKLGSLIDRDFVVRDAADIAAVIRSSLYAMPPKMAAVCHGKDRKDIERLLKRAVDDIMVNLQNKIQDYE